MMKMCYRCLLVCAVLAWSRGVFATTLSVEVLSPVNVGERFDVAVLVDDVADLAGFEFTLAYDPTLLEGVSATSGALFGADGFLLASGFDAGEASFAEVSLAPFGVDVATPSLLATFAFSALNVGVSPLRLDNVVLSDSLGTSIGPVTLLNAGVTIAGTTSVPLPGSLLLLASGMALLRRHHRMPAIR
ncbi:MAG TPA: hypothetical protein ENJ21_06440 [Chromatiaceae bacterium]|nr:hypothetical protein [Chromatiaceae bacterium]